MKSMTRTLLIASVFALPTLLSPPAGSAQAAADSLAAKIDPIFARWRGSGSPGAAVVVVKDGVVVFQKGYGHANLDFEIPITPATVFDIASVSKHFTAFAIAMLAEQGKLSLDDDIREHIPELPAFGKTVTIRHLIHHTSGVRDWVELLSIGGFRFDDVIALPDILAFARRQNALNFEPGAEYAYSNTGYNLLAETVSRVSGRPFARFMEEEIFGPLGMEDTRILTDHQQVVKNRAASYAPNENVDELRNLHAEPPPANGRWRTWVDNTSAPGSSSVLTSVRDMAKWIRNFETAQVGGRTVLEQMLERGVLNSGERIDYAFGLSVNHDRGLTAVSHGGGWRGFRTHILLFPEEHVGISVLGNSTSFDAGGTAMRVAEAVLGDRLRPLARGPDRVDSNDPPRAEKSAALPPDRLSEYAGEYHSEEVGTTYAIHSEGGSLVVTHRKMPDQVLSPIGEDRFVTPGVRGELTYAFTRDDAGQVTGYSLAGARFRGVRFERRLPRRRHGP